MSDKSINDFINECAESGLSFRFRATNGEITIVGECVDGKITKRKVASTAESRENIKTMFK
jgi:hypothetical protein